MLALSVIFYSGIPEANFGIHQYMCLINIRFNAETPAKNPFLKMDNGT